MIAGGVFSAITFALFEALSIELPEIAMRLFAGGGIGAIPVLAVVAVYQPGRSPAAQWMRVSCQMPPSCARSKKRRA